MCAVSSLWLPLSTSLSSCRPCASSFSSSSPTSCSWQTCTTPLRTVWTSTTSSPSPQVMSPRPMTSTSFWTRRRSSPTQSLLRTRTTTTLHSRICSITHIEHKSIAQYEKICLSVSRRRQCQNRKFLQNAKQELVDTNFKQLEPKKSNDFFKDYYGSKSWNFVKPIKEVLLRWKN